MNKEAKSEYSNYCPNCGTKNINKQPTFDYGYHDGWKIECVNCGFLGEVTKYPGD